MKGVANIILFVVLMLVLTIVALHLSSQAKTMYENKSVEIGEIFHPIKAYYFDIESLVVNPNSLTWNQANKYFCNSSICNEYNLPDSNFCQKLKACIKTYIQTEQPCEIGPIYLKDSLYTGYPGTPISTGLGCNEEDLMEEVNGMRKICRFNNQDPHNEYLYENDNLLKDHQPYFHLCNIPEGFKNLVNDYTIYKIRDPLTTDYELPSFTFGGGLVKIVLTNITVNDTWDCNFNLFVCAQPAVASSLDSATIEIFRYFQDFDLTQPHTEYADNWVYHYHFVTLDGTYDITTIKNTINAALWEWSRDPRHYENTELARLFNSGANKIHFAYDPWESSTSLTGICIPTITDKYKPRFYSTKTQFSGSMDIRLRITNKTVGNDVILYPHVGLCETGVVLDTTGPTVSSVNVNPATVTAGQTSTLTASISDSATGNSNIAAAKWSKGASAAPADSGISMSAVGVFDSPTESVTAPIDTTGWAADTYTIWVRGQDSKGNWGSAVSTTLTVAERNIVFVTSTTTTGKIEFNGKTGLEAADAICQSLAVDAHLPGTTYMAWLSDSTTSVVNRFTTKSSVPYVLVDGTVIADDWIDLTDWTINADININETGDIIEGITRFYVWTSTFADGSIGSVASTCNDWTESASNIQGTCGTTEWEEEGVNYYWTFQQDRYCNEEWRLYCFEQ